MNVLLLGSGGREHTLAWKLAQSKKLTRLFVAPGNAGTAQVAVNVNISATDFDKLASFSLENQIDIILVGPEAPLVEGIADYFGARAELRHIGIVGPNQSAARLEGSKDFSKQFMFRHQIPTAAAQTFSLEELEEGYRFLEAQKAPYVLKADGLAAGKGVIITPTLEEAKSSLKEMLEGKFGQASKQVLIEEFLSGIELSVFVLTDGKNYVLLPSAKDYKRVGVADTGLNTGGMGAVSPVPFADALFMSKVEERIIRPTVKGLAQEGIDYVGFIFFGLINVGGEPYVIEYNARMGDPETEVVIPRLTSDLLELLVLTTQQKLDQAVLTVSPQTAVTVMLVSGGYPEQHENGKIMTGFELVKEVLPFHAGTKYDANGNVITNGGRVLALTALGDTQSEALQKAYRAAETIVYDKKYYRSDIGFDLSV